MNAGIDFGTSTCSIGVWRDGRPSLLKLEGDSTRLISALHSARSSIGVADLDDKALKKEIARIRRRAAAAAPGGRQSGPGKRLTEEQLESHARGEWRLAIEQARLSRQPRRDAGAALYADDDITFGEAAVREHMLDPQSGYFVKSPKSFLGADIKRQHIDQFSEIITRMLAHIKHRAETQVEGEIDAICLGRPVNFHGLRGEAGNRQAVSILEAAAVAAGFRTVEFMFEPIAAALDYERTITRDVVALIVDAGGGTTDCSMVRIGPSYRNELDRTRSVLGYSGDRIGGTDIDIKLSIRRIMPHFGLDTLLDSGLPIPNSVYWNAVTINDVNALADFSSEKTGRDLRMLVAQARERDKVSRLQTVHDERLSYRLNRSAELAKISLSDRDSVMLPLDYVEPGFNVPLTRAELKESVQHELGKFVGLMQEVQRQSQVAPEVIYVTGGTASSPMVEECIRANFGDVEIVIGDLFGSVTSGLATWAHRIFA